MQHLARAVRTQHRQSAGGKVPAECCGSTRAKLHWRLPSTPPSLTARMRLLGIYARRIAKNGVLLLEDLCFDCLKS